MPFKSIYDDVDVPATDIWDSLFERKTKPYPDSHIIFTDENNHGLTYSDVYVDAKAFGKGLQQSLKWNKGDKLAVVALNTLEVPRVVWGAHYAQATVVMIGAATQEDLIAVQLRGEKQRLPLDGYAKAAKKIDARVKAIFTQEDFLPKVAAACAQIGFSKDMIFLLEESGDDMYKTWEKIRDEGVGIPDIARRTYDSQKDVAFILYTSATGSPIPKGVCLSHTNIIANILQFRSIEEEDLHWKSDRTLLCLPVTHSYPLGTMLHYPFYHGVSMIMMKEMDLVKYLGLIQEHKITYLHLAPPLATAIDNLPHVVDKFDLSSVRMCTSAASPLSRKVMDSLWKKYNFPIRQGYGQTECSPVIALQPWSDIRRTVGSNGYLISNMTAKIVDASGTEVPKGKTGELLLRGPNVMLGYHNLPSADAKVFTDGWLRTGDLARLDNEQNVWLEGRVNEIIETSGGQTIMPYGLEEAIKDHENVADVAVKGVTAPDGSVIAKAFIVLKPGSVETNPGTFVQFVKSHYDKPEAHFLHAAEFVKALPRSPAGKLFRRLLPDVHVSVI